MNDYFDLLKEYQDLQSNFKEETDNIRIIAYYVQSFGKAISTLLACIKSTDPKKDESLLFFTKLYKNLIEDLKKSNLFNNDLILPLQQMNESQNNFMKGIFNSFNSIKNNLFETKQKLNNAKKEYFDFIKENKEIIKAKKTDDNLLYEAKKQNFFILYKYELDKMNQKIDDNNKKYNQIMNELETMNMHKENTYKKSLLEFGKIVGTVGNQFIEFEKKLKDKFSDKGNNMINEIKNNEVKARFKKEEIENEPKGIIFGKNNEINIQSNNLILAQNNLENINQDNNLKNKKNNSGFDFEILDEPITTENAKINSIMDEIIQKLTAEEEINSSQITELFERIKYDYSKYSLNFLTKIKKYYKNRVISCKNKQNFIHLSNIINTISVKKENKNIFNEIIEVSKMINYEDVFISSMIQKKNRFLSSKTFWMNLIEDNLILELNIFTANLLKISIKTAQKEAKMQKTDNKRKLEKKEDILTNLYNQVYGYKKLNKKQKDLLKKNAKDRILLIVSQSVANMCYFFVTEQSIMDIISHYVEIFELDIESYYYFKNILSVNFKKKYLKMKQNYDEAKEKYGFHLTLKEIIILNASKFLPKDNYINIFKLNKDINIKVKNNLLKYQLTKFDISIDERLKIWEIFLNIKEIKKKYNYAEIKAKYLKRDIPKGKEKNFSIIDLDFSRTPLFREDKNHNQMGSTALKCVCSLESNIDYYQGMNFVLLFLYQLLNYDEEKTFYFFLAIERNTKYHELFENDLADLVTYFKVFEKILEINLPEIFYSLLDKQIMTQFFSTSWFVTLFTSEVSIFEKEKAPNFILMAFEGFVFEGWAGIVNAGLALLNYNKEQILSYDGNELMKYMISDVNNINNVAGPEFEKMQKTYLYFSEKINENFIKKLIDIIKFEENHKQLKVKEINYFK